MRAFPNVYYRNYFHEYDRIMVEVDFRNETTWPAQENGRNQAQDFLTA
jgi:hypothetical protein